MGKVILYMVLKSSVGYLIIQTGFFNSYISYYNTKCYSNIIFGITIAYDIIDNISNF